MAQTSRSGHAVRPRYPLQRRAAGRRRPAPSRRPRRAARARRARARSISSTCESTARCGASARSHLERLRVARLLHRRLAELLRDHALARVRVVLEDAEREHREVERAEVGRLQPCVSSIATSTRLPSPSNRNACAFSASSGIGVIVVPPSSNGSPSATRRTCDRALALHEAELVGEAVVLPRSRPRRARGRRSASSRSGAATSGTRSCATPRPGGRRCGRDASASRARPRSASPASGSAAASPPRACRSARPARGRRRSARCARTARPARAPRRRRGTGRRRPPGRGIVDRPAASRQDLDRLERSERVRRSDADRVPDGLQLEERRDLVQALRVGRAEDDALHVLGRGALEVGAERRRRRSGRSRSRPCARRATARARRGGR